MQRFRWIALQGNSRGLLPPLLLFYFITTSGIPAFAADVSAACSSPVARVVSIQGSIEVLPAHQKDWSRVTRLDTPLCEGDRLRTGALSRAALFIQPETLVRVDQNTSISVSQTAEETLVEFTQEEVLPAAAGAYSCGAGYFITRFPRKFRVNTPHLNAAVEGTEFLVAMRCERTELSVFEGKVRAQAISTPEVQVLTSGQVLAAGPTTPPAIRLLVKPTDAVQWALYYPPLSDASVAAQFPSSSDCLQLPDGLKQVCFSQRAEQLLRLGRVDEAESEITQALAESPTNGDVLAIRAVISVVKNDKEGALSAGQKAVEASPNSSRAWLALSYAQQASFKLEDALKSVQRAAEISADSSLVQARLAELFMSLGRARDAERAARRAVEANPNEERAYTVLGFVHLAQIKVKEAQIDFQNALERDSTAPLPRLGLGLAVIRQGQLVPGREQLEIAVALDPTNSLLRSYVGKAYYEENTRERDQLAETQFDLAKRLDPNDPTPWFYRAILEETQSRPIRAIKELKESYALNDNRAIYRSRLLLDEDLAARSLSMAEIFKDLGIGQVALSEAMQSVNDDPQSFSAHRFLAETYAITPRHEIARVSELLQSQLLQPATANPIPLQLAESKILVPVSAGPSAVSFQEFSSVFARDGLRTYLSGEVGNNQTWGDEALIRAQLGGTSVTLSQFHFQTEGFRPNNDLSDSIYGLFFQHDISATSSVQVELRSRKLDNGDITLHFDPNTFSSGFRESLDTDQIRLGMRFSPSTILGTTLVSLIFQDRAERESDMTSFAGFDIDSRVNVESDTGIAEIQHLFRSNDFSLTGGLGYYAQDSSRSDFFRVLMPPGIVVFEDISSADSVIRHENAYIYSTVTPHRSVSITGGLSWDSLDHRSPFTKEQWNPKLGLIVKPASGTTLRAAAFRTLKRAIVANQTLEPTQVAGFNQFFDDVNGTDAVRAGVGFDQKISVAINAGAELSGRSLKVPELGVGLLGDRITDWDERRHRAYVSWLTTQHLSVNVEVLLEQLSRDFAPGFATTFPSRSDTTFLPVTATLTLSAGILAVLRSTYVRQYVEFPNALGTVDSGKDRFWVTDLSLRYRFPRRQAFISFRVNNVFDKSFRFQDTNLVGDPHQPLFQPARTALLNFGVTF